MVVGRERGFFDRLFYSWKGAPLVAPARGLQDTACVEGCDILVTRGRCSRAPPLVH